MQQSEGAQLLGRHAVEPEGVMVRLPSARKSRARTTEATLMTASITGVATPSRAARSVKKIRE